LVEHCANKALVHLHPMRCAPTIPHANAAV
jgi:hypothetical protein